MTHLWPEGAIIVMECQAETYVPLWFRWADETHPVDQVVKRWRLDADWWQGRVWREYFKVTTRSGLLAVVYLDWLTGEWYLQRLYD